MHIAIVGAGISGLTCARQLQSQGHHVTVYEKNDGVSGRMSTRQTELGGFDHGAQYFTATTERFRKEVADWRKIGWVAPWVGKLASLDGGASKPAGNGTKRFVPVPGMSSLGKHIAHGLDVRLEQQVMAVEWADRHWLLSLKADTVPVQATAGPFDAVVLAVPADQAIPLLQHVPAFAKQAQKARLAPCWTLMLGFQAPLALEYDGAWVNHSRLGWIARDTAKPAHRAGERWVCHATAAWSLKHLEDDPERVKEKLSKAFHEATGSYVQPIHAVTHRWRYSQAVQPLGENCLWNGKQGLGVCGDWFAVGLDGSGRVENAYLSGLALAAAIGS